MIDDDDTLDALVLRAMKSLDDQVPAGYFEDLPNRTLGRLEDRSMDTAAASSDEDGKPVEREEDSGLHDIRSLASSTRMRLSSRRISTSPPADDELLASSSGAWKAVALPEPARVVELPALPDVKSSAKLDAVTPAATARVVATVVATDEIPSTQKHAAKVAAATPRPNRSLLIGGIAGAVAAAAVAVLVVTSRGGHTTDDRSPPIATPAAAPPAPVDVEPKQAEPKKAEPAPAQSPVVVTSVPIDTKGAEPTPAPEPIAKAPVKAPATEPAKPIGKRKVLTKQDPEPGFPDSKPGPVKKSSKIDKPESEPPVQAPSPAPTTKKSEEPDFNDLLKEAGVDQTKQPAKPKLEKQSLDASDFKTGMNAIRAKAQGCYNGTQGMASVKLTIAPTGRVTKVAVTGPFADTPVAGCVEAAVRGATFPAWDGAPQSFGYSYLLSE
jgi:hypothetical protein